MSEIEEFEIVAPSPPVRKDPSALALASAREKLVKYLPRAVEIITELAETSENDRVRLAAAESIADRAGLGKSSTTQVQVSQAEHDIAQQEVAKLLEGIDANQAALSVGTHTVPLDVLVVHEGEIEDVLPVAST
jgi:hypothetical protein